MRGTLLMPGSLSVARRRYARRRAYENVFLWAIGNGLISSTLIVYLALEVGGSRAGLGISLILAAPRIAGLLRLAVPAMIGHPANRKRFCLATYAASAIVLLGLPVVAVPGVLSQGNASLAAVVGLWCAYHLLEFFATVALWSWQADLVRQRVRGRFLGRRERWMLIGQAAAMLAAALFSYAWKLRHPKDLDGLCYAILAVLGALAMLLALVPLAAMPHFVPGGSRAEAARTARSWASIVSPFLDRRYLRLLAFGCWFSLVNGLTQSAQNVFPARVLGLGIFVMLALQTGLRLGQWTISPWLGRIADRRGNKPVMLASLPIVALGLLFYAAASPRQPQWIAGAWVAWIAYAGINVGQPNLMLKLSPRDHRTAYVGAFHAVTGLMVAVSTIAGGWCMDRFAGSQFHVWTLGPLDFYRFSFVLGAAGRALGVLFLLLVSEEVRARSASE